MLSIGGNVCTAIAHFNGVQTVDGLDEEFCGIVATEFDVATGAWQQPGDGGADVDTVAYLRVAWDAVGLHLFINVVQPVVIAPSAYAYIWTGDAVEIFASATGTLKGSYGPGADPALQVIVSAPSSSSPALSQELTSVTGPTVALDASSFAVRLVPSGYNVEVELPWSLIAGGQDIEPEGGTRIGFDFACDLNGAHGTAPDAGTTRDFQSSLSWIDPDGVYGNCGTASLTQEVGPFCDDLTWGCTPLLVP